ncbi:MAG TPA: leucyl aminopeptidase [Candidatus Polarisedimenticolia bacterium]|nr:leucyl aminopeptidase [Candidatus Polarisedimenticolia bacterium]
MSVSLEFETRAGELAGVAADLGIVPRFKGENSLVGPVGSALEKRLLEVAKEDRFQGRSGRLLLWHAPEGAFPCRRYLLLGLGSREDLTLERYRRDLGDAFVEADRLGAASVALPLLTDDRSSFPPPEAARALSQAALMGTYRFDRYRSEPRPGRRHLKLVRVATGAAAEKAVTSGLAWGDKVSAAVNLARDLVNEPPGILTPPRLAEIAEEQARARHLEVEVFAPPALRKMGMGGILGVAQGSHQEPRLVRLHYRPKGKPERKVAILGKGLTFDSGGLSLKTSEGMETMKCDMAGSAAVLATMVSLQELGCRAEVIGLMGIAENMPGGQAIRPGDVLRIMNGKTVEVRNTDAEGRLVLADCLSYASQIDGLQAAVDLATLTGACVVALGPLASGLMSNNQPLADALLAAAAASGEAVWQLPLYSEYREHIKSDVADIKNTGIRWGGAITAALFLQEFVREGLPWAHLDIAGPAFGEKEYSYLGKGGSGAGVRTLLRWLVDPPA